MGSETCLECHDDFGEHYAHNVHSRLADFQYTGTARDCEACHGPGQTHAETGEANDIGRLSADMGGEASAACVSCHRTGHLAEWDLGAHAGADVSCLACHQIHAAEPMPALLNADEQELCFSCHLEQKARMSMPSHHPLQEGFMSCSDCHDPHREAFAGLLDVESGRDLCLTCHAQYMGPFVFEHSPVEEDCGICHDPHGSIANSLLRQNEPFLCLQCHQPHFHAGLTGYEGAFNPDMGSADLTDDFPGYFDDLLPGSGAEFTSHADAMKRVMLTRCSQCHQSIHGTDLPSQSIPGQGRALNR